MNNEKVDICSNRIAYALALRGMKQSELCEKTKIPKSAMSQYISGKFEPKQDRLYLIAKALDVNEVWLMGYDVSLERTESQKKNDQLVKLIVRMRNDSGFADLVRCLDELHPEQYESIKQLLIAFSKQ